MREPSYDDSVSVTREIHWVGYFDEQADLHCNPYLLLDDEEAVLFDPGSIPHFPAMMRKVIDVVNPAEISTIVVSHEDPDVCGNLAIVEDVIERDDLRVVAHSHSIRFLRHYGLRSSYHAVDREGYRLTLKSGRELEFIWAPYLHSAGTIMTLDRRSRTLFSGDLFGGLGEGWALFARGDGWRGPMRAFHELVMPTNLVLRACMERLAGHDLERVLPQHGSILEGPAIGEAIDLLRELRCGVDLLGG